MNNQTCIQKEISIKLKILRTYHNYTQEYVAFKLDVCQKTYSNIENGKVKIDLLLLQKICAFYDISIGKLVEWCPLDQLNSDRISKNLT